SSASPAAMVLLPTPPLPVTNTSRRSSREVVTRRRSYWAKVVTGSWSPRSWSEGCEADPPLARFRADVDVRHLVGGHPHLAAATVGEPQHAAPAPDRCLDRGHQLVAVRVVCHLDLDLLRGVDHADSNFHVYSSRWVNLCAHSGRTSADVPVL